MLRNLVMWCCVVDRAFASLQPDTGQAQSLVSLIPTVAGEGHDTGLLKEGGQT